MVVLTKLFKSSRKKTETQQPEFSQLSSEQKLDHIRSLENSDQQLKLVNGLEDFDLLISLAFDQKIPGAARAARKSLANAVNAGQLDFSKIKQNAQQDHDALLALLDIAGHCDNRALQEELLEGIQDEQKLAQLAQSASAAKVRQLAAANLNSQPLLETLAKHSKGKDKTVYRICKEKLEQIKESARKESERLAQLGSLCASAEKHQSSSVNHLYGAKIKNLKDQWLLVKEDASDSVKTRFEQAIQAGEEKWQQYQDEKAQEEAEAKAAAHAAEEEQLTGHIANEERLAIVQKLLTEFNQLLNAESIDHDHLSQSRNHLFEIQNEWQKSENQQGEHTKASKTEVREFSHLCTEFEAVLGMFEHMDHMDDIDIHSFADLVEKARVEVTDENDTKHQLTDQLDQLVHHLDVLPTDQRPEVLTSAEKVLKAQSEQQAKQKQHRQQAIHHIRGLIRKANWAIQQGHLRQSSGIVRTLKEKQEQIPHLPHSIERQLEQVDAELEKLKDWQNFAVEPKKRALVERMEAMVGSDQHPDQLARHIRKLQDEWKGLSRGGKNQHQDLWEKFHEAAQKAYEPCKAYFQEQSHQRKDNLKSRQKLVAQLKELIEQLHLEDEQDLNWKSLEQAIQVAKNEWRQYSPVERAANKPVQTEFEQLINQIQEKLNGKFQQVKETKQKLIGEAALLLEQENVRDATEAAKLLQKRWKEAGRTWRNEDQKLWKEFRGICDELFERRETQSREFKEELQHHLDSATQLCEQVEALASHESIDPAQAKKQLSALQRDFEHLGNLPRQQAKAITQRWQDGVSALQAQIRKADADKELDQWTQADEVALKSESVAALADSLKALNFPASLHQGVAEVKTPDDLRSICVRLEILAGIDSPSEDSQYRMGLQVERLQSGMGNRKSSQDEFNELMVHYLAAAQTDGDSPYLARIKAARDAFLTNA